MEQDKELWLLPRKQVAEIYGIPRRFLELAAQRGDGPPFVKIGRLCFYRRSDIEAWLEAQTITIGSYRR